MASLIRRIDIAVALAALIIIGPVSLMIGYDQSSGQVLLIIAFSIAILFRRAAPVSSAAVVHLLALTQALMPSMGILPIDVIVLVSVYSVCAHGPIWGAIAAEVSGLIGACILATFLAGSSISNWLALFLLTTLSLAVASTLGFSRKSRLAQRTSDEERLALLERSRTTDAELAVAAERARIAREMHDVVAHSLAVIIAQADGGRYAGATNPAQATRALNTISEIGRAALRDIRSILGVLRNEDSDTANVSPQPDVDDIAEVVERVRQTGAEVALTRIGTPRQLPPATGLTLQRVCQEALTNVLKHGGDGARMSVLLCWESDSLTLQIDDDGRGAAAITDGTGIGILGMTERAAIVGGRLQAGPKLTGGYRVKLVVPVPKPQSEES